MQITKEKIVELVDEVCEGTDMFPIHIAINDGFKIMVEMDADEGLSIEKIVKVSRHIEHTFDRDEFDFELSVTSPGVDKPLRNPRQFRKNEGRELRVVNSDDRVSKGVLTQSDENGFAISWKEKERLEGRKKKVWVDREEQFKYSDVKEAKVLVSFK